MCLQYKFSGDSMRAACVKRVIFQVYKTVQSRRRRQRRCEISLDYTEEKTMKSLLLLSEVMTASLKLSNLMR